MGARLEPRLGLPVGISPPRNTVAPHPVFQGLQVEFVPDTGQGVDGLAEHCGEERRKTLLCWRFGPAHVPLAPGWPQLTLHVAARNQTLHAAPRGRVVTGGGPRTGTQLAAPLRVSPAAADAPGSLPAHRPRKPRPRLLIGPDACTSVT